MPKLNKACTQRSASSAERDGAAQDGTAALHPARPPLRRRSGAQQSQQKHPPALPDGRSGAIGYEPKNKRFSSALPPHFDLALNCTDSAALCPLLSCTTGRLRALPEAL